MARKKVTISLQDVLLGRYDEWEKEPAKLGAELDSDLNALFDTLNGYELADTVIVRCRKSGAICIDFRDVKVTLRIYFALYNG